MKVRGESRELHQPAGAEYNQVHVGLGSEGYSEHHSSTHTPNIIQPTHLNVLYSAVFEPGLFRRGLPYIHNSTKTDFPANTNTVQTVKFQ